MPKLALALALLAALAAPAAATAQPTRTAALQRALDRYVATGVPGAVVLARDGRRTVRLTAGRSRISPAAPVRADQRFRIGSVTKTFVATVALQLVQEHRLRLSDTVERWLPGAVPNGGNITLRMLLNHTSGLYDYTTDPDFFAPYEAGDFGFTYTPRQLVDVAVSHPPAGPPGSPWAYSNTGYVLAGLMVEAATGHTLRAELDARIFRPLKLRHTSFPSRPHIHGPHAHGYTPIDGELVDVTGLSPSWGWAAGAIVSTADDVATFERALLRGRLLSRATLARMRTTVPMWAGEDYGLGLWRTHTASTGEERFSCGAAWGHNGDEPGWHADAFANRRRQVVLLSNLSGEEAGKASYAAQFRVLEAALC